MPVPLSLISTLMSRAVSDSGLPDSFENWPNGTNGPPKGWTLDFGSSSQMEQSTSNVTDGTYSAYIDMAEAGDVTFFGGYIEFGKTFDLTGISSLKLDVTLDSGDKLEVLVNGSVVASISSGSGTLSGDVSAYTGDNDVHLRQYGTYNSSIDFTVGSSWVDNLRPAP